MDKVFKSQIAYFLIFYLLLNNIHAQTQSDIDLMKHSIPDDIKKSNYELAKGNKNEIQLLFSGFFLFYKQFISSQDLPGTCNFHPSCSEYGILSVKKNGLFIGVFSSFDRLTRCNGLNREQYVRDEKTGRLLDYP